MSFSRESRKSALVVFAAALALGMGVASSSFAADPVEITHCGQQFSGDGFLTADLDCTDPIHDDQPGVIIKHRGRLDLRGFSILKGAKRQGVYCLGVCHVFGGSLVTSRRARAAVAGQRRVTVEDVTIEGGWTRGVRSARGVVILNSVIRQCRQVGVRSASRRAFVINSQILGNGLRGVDKNGIGISAAQHVEIVNSLITANFRFGVVVDNGRAIIKDSLLEENNLNDFCFDTTPCSDVRTFRRPVMENSSCEASDRILPGLGPKVFTGLNWGICLNDAAPL